MKISFGVAGIPLHFSQQPNFYRSLPYKTQQRCTHTENSNPIRKKLLAPFLLLLSIIQCGCIKDRMEIENSLSFEVTTGKGGSSVSTLAAPTNLKGTAISFSSVNLSWKDNSTNETGFIVERKISNGFYSVISTLPSNTVTFQDNNLSEGVTYSYRTKAYNGSNSSYSNTSNVTTLVDLTTSLVAYYPFNGNVNDESGNGLNLTIFGSPMNVADRLGKQNSALLFNGTTDYLYHDRDNAFLLGGYFTLNAWIYSDQVDGLADVIVGNLDLPDLGGYQLTLYMGPGLRFDLRNGSSRFDFFQSLDLNFFGKWKMVTGVFTPNSQTLFIDGTAVGTQQSSFLVDYSGSNNFRIGANPHALDNSRLFKGMIDDVRIYNRALTQDQITYLATH